MIITLNGPTSLVGRNLLFELIKSNMKNLDSIHLILLGRNAKEKSLKERIYDIICFEGVFELESVELEYFLNNNVEYIEIDFEKNDLGIQNDDFLKLKQKTIDVFYQVAALTDFRDTPFIAEKLNLINVEGTKKLIKLFECLDIKKVCCVGSAYACGKTTGVIQPDYINSDQEFRNPYEITKLKSEILMREYSKFTNTKFYFFRLSTVCGRLMNTPLGTTYKFDVFYAWGQFFLHSKIKITKNWGFRYLEDYDFNARMSLNEDAGLNIVSADYIAKVLTAFSTHDSDYNSFHIVNHHETPHINYLAKMCEKIKISGITYIDRIPEDQNKIEALFYRTVGKVYAPYTVSGKMIFDLTTLDNFLKTNNIKIDRPEINMSDLDHLFTYAQSKDFGLKREDYKWEV